MNIRPAPAAVASVWPRWTEALFVSRNPTYKLKARMDSPCIRITSWLSWGGIWRVSRSEKNAKSTLRARRKVNMFRLDSPVVPPLLGICQNRETSSPVFAVARRGLMWCWAQDFVSACWSWASSVFWVFLLCHVLESVGNPVEENNVLKMKVARPTTAQKRTRRFLWWINGVSLVQSEGWEIISWRWQSWIVAMECCNIARRRA